MRSFTSASDLRRAGPRPGPEARRSAPPPVGADVRDPVDVLGRERPSRRTPAVRDDSDGAAPAPSRGALDRREHRLRARGPRLLVLSRAARKKSSASTSLDSTSETLRPRHQSHGTGPAAKVPRRFWGTELPQGSPTARAGSCGGPDGSRRPGESAPQAPGYRVLGINWANPGRKCPADSGAPRLGTPNSESHWVSRASPYASERHRLDGCVGERPSLGVVAPHEASARVAGRKGPTLAC